MIDIAAWDITKIKLQPLSRRPLTPTATENIRIVGLESLKRTRNKQFHNFVLTADEKQHIQAKFVTLRCKVTNIDESADAKTRLLNIDGFPQVPNGCEFDAHKRWTCKHQSHVC